MLCVKAVLRPFVVQQCVYIVSNSVAKTGMHVGELQCV